MISNEDLILSNTSYTDKDFPALYNDALDIAKKLSNSWIPSQSNESDPGVVLLKEAAFLADHLNYNIDKNVLESMLPSATQETSVRNIVEMNGYTPRYYMSASGYVKFVYNGDVATPFSIPKFTISLTDDSRSISYVQVEALSFAANGNTGTALFMEGTLNTLTVNGSTTITMSNIDNSNRVYLPVKNVAQNGIYITGGITSISGEWTRTNYILTEPAKSAVYKLDYDSKLGKAYIEFPSDIASIIGDGLTIKYVVSSGVDGCIAADILTTVNSPSAYTTTAGEISMSDFTITNQTAFLSGKDPETIDEMYKSFMHIAGTFDTLVTRNDYTNAIRNILYEDTANPVISNGVVSDNMTDYNNATTIICIDDYGRYYEHIHKSSSLNLSSSAGATPPATPKQGDIWFCTSASSTYEANKFYMYVKPHWVETTNISYDNFTTLANTMTPLDLCIYALKSYNLSAYNSSDRNSAISKSFTPATSTTIGTLTNQLSNLKCINHNMTAPKVGDVIAFKNYAPLGVTIMPYNKVSAEEAKSIINSVYFALSNNFNASGVEFGEELNYEELVRIMEESDTRIKSIRLEDIEYTTKVLVKTEQSSITSDDFIEVDLQLPKGEANPYDASKDYISTLIAKNILAGRVFMFNVGDSFGADFATMNRDLYENAQSISSEVEIAFPSTTESAYKLRENESIYALTQAYHSTLSYPMGVNYDWTGAQVQEGADHTIADDESLTLTYISYGSNISKQYKSGEVFQPSFTMGASGSTSSEGTLSANQTIDIREPSLVTITSRSLPCVWNRKNNTNTLFLDGEYTYILGSGEFFAYSNDVGSSFTIFTTGTMLVRSENDNNDWTLESANDSANIDTTTQWRYQNFADNNTFYIRQMTTRSFTTGTSIMTTANVENDSSGAVPISNTWQLFATNHPIKYSDDGTNWSTLPANDYYVRSVLSINCDSDNGQALSYYPSLQSSTDETVIAIPSVSIDYKGSSSPIVLTPTQGNPIYFKSSVALNLTNDTPTNISSYETDIVKYVTGEGYRSKYENGSITTYLTPYNKAYVCNNEDEGGEYTFYISYAKKDTCLLPIHVLSTDSTDSTAPTLTISVATVETNVTKNIREMIFDTTYVASKSIVDPNLYNILVQPGSGTESQNIKITIDKGDNTKASFVLYQPVIFDGLNEKIKGVYDNVLKAEGSTHVNVNGFSLIEEAMKTLIQNSDKPSVHPSISEEPSGDNDIQIYDFTNGNVMFEPNNVANAISIPQIDLRPFVDGGSHIDIYKSMKDYT